jgi:hypothetical protein
MSLLTLIIIEVEIGRNCRPSERNKVVESWNPEIITMFRMRFFGILKTERPLKGKYIPNPIVDTNETKIGFRKVCTCTKSVSRAEYMEGFSMAFLA